VSLLKRHAFWLKRVLQLQGWKQVGLHENQL